MPSISAEKNKLFTTPQQVWGTMKNAVSSKKTAARNHGKSQVRKFVTEQRRVALKMLQAKPPASFQELFDASLYYVKVNGNFDSVGCEGQSLHKPNHKVSLAEIAMINEPKHSRNNTVLDYNVMSHLDHMVDLCDFLYYCMEHEPKGAATFWRTAVGHIWGVSVEYDDYGEERKFLEGILTIQWGERVPLPAVGNYILRA